MIWRNRTLTVEPTGGLANRMRVVDSAVILAEQLGRSLTVVWTRTTDLHARFDELFEALPGVQVRENSWTMSRLQRVLLRSLGFYRPFLDQAAIEARPAHQARFGDLAAGRPFIITCSQLNALPQPLRRFVPVASLRREIAELTRDFGSSMVGIHVRRGDHLFAQRSPTEAFVAWMTAEMKRDPDTRFFLATDSPAEETRLEQAFPGRIASRRKQSYDRGCREGVRDAVVDLYGLARTRRIAGTYFSSFSEAASQLGGIELVVMDTELAGPDALTRTS